MKSTINLRVANLSLAIALAVASGIAGGAPLVVQSAGEIDYLSGGVGASEQELLERVKHDYNLRLLFAVSGSGEFLASVPVRISDATGRVLVDTVSEGPYFYANVPPGSYRISTEHAGQVRIRDLRVPASEAVSEGFYWSGER